jgi:hypothetical protein
VRKNKGYTPCPENEAWIASTSDCEIGLKTASPRSFLFWGDSHARVLSSSTGEIAAGKGLKGLVIFRGGCPPFLPQAKGAFGKRNCTELAQRVETLLKGRDFSNVVLVARWALYAEGGGTTEPRSFRSGAARDGGQDRRQWAQRDDRRTGA